MNSVNLDYPQSDSAVNNKKNKKSRNTKGALTAYAASFGVNALASVPSLLISKNFANDTKLLTQSEVANINKQADHLLNKLTNLGKKGVTIENITTTPPILDMLPPVLKKFNPITIISEGKNAVFNPSLNQIQINREKLPLSIFHEMGHAFNFNNSKFWKAMQISSLTGKNLAPLMMLFAAFTKKEVATEGKELTKKQKIKNGIRESSPLISVGLMLPTLLEEGKATLRANKWAKQILDPKHAKLVTQKNAIAYSTYVIVALGLGLATYTAKKVKDHFDEKKAMKANNIN